MPESLHVVIGEVSGRDKREIKSVVGKIYSAVKTDLNSAVQEAIRTSRRRGKSNTFEIDDNLTFKTSVVQDPVTKILVHNGADIPMEYRGRVFVTIDNEIGATAVKDFLQSKEPPSNCFMTITIKLLR